MNPALQNLKDIHLPKAIPMWPLAPGWILLFFVLIGILGYVIYFIYQRKRKRQTILFILQQLKALQALTQHNPDNINITAQLSILMRRAALHYYKRDEVAGLSGEAWLQFLNVSGNTTQFTLKIGQLLIDAPYCKQHSADLSDLFSLVHNWLLVMAKKNSKE